MPGRVVGELAHWPDESFNGNGTSSRGAGREFRDRANRLWTVCEAPFPVAEWTSANDEEDIAGYGVGWLWFRSGDVQRRRRLYPKWWDRLSDADLERLCQGALEAGR